MEGQQPGMPVDRRMQRGDVAVADQRLGVAPDQFKVELVKQAHAAVAPTHAQDGVHGRIGKRCMQVLQALLVRPRQVALRLQGTRVDTAPVAAVNEPLANLLRIKPRRARRGDNGKTCVGRQRGWQGGLEGFGAIHRDSLQRMGHKQKCRCRPWARIGICGSALG